MTVASQRWFALYVRVRHERAVELQLTGRGLEAFLPCYHSRRKWSDRFKSVELPLFLGYVFCRMSNLQRSAVLSTHGVVRIVGFGPQLMPVDESELVALQRAVHAGLPCEPVPYLATGEPVRVVSGPLYGLQGLLLDVRDRHCLVLSISLLRRSVSVEVDRSQIERLGTEIAANGG